MINRFKTLSLLIIHLSLGYEMMGQQKPLFETGSITYEKVINTYAVAKNSGMNEQVFEAFKKVQSQFLILHSQLFIDKSTTLYLPNEASTSPLMFNSVMAFPHAIQRNKVFSDFGSHMFVSQKELPDRTLLLSDTLISPRWKLTDEFRDVAGYTCRRANALLHDSIYIVAFYTNEIHLSGGPELFGGLPGLILEVALPHEHLLWRATNIKIANTVKIVPPSRGTIINFKSFTDELTKMMLNVDTNIKSVLIKEFIL